MDTMAQVRKVKYVAGSGVFLQEKLSDGQDAFEAGIVYTIPDYSDFMRLTQYGDFLEVFDEIVEVVAEPAAVVLVPVAEVAEPKKKDKVEDKGDTNS